MHAIDLLPGVSHVFSMARPAWPAHLVGEAVGAKDTAQGSLLWATQKRRSHKDRKGKFSAVRTAPQRSCLTGHSLALQRFLCKAQRQQHTHKIYCLTQRSNNQLYLICLRDPWFLSLDTMLWRTSLSPRQIIPCVFLLASHLPFKQHVIWILFAFPKVAVMGCL